MTQRHVAGTPLRRTRRYPASPALSSMRLARGVALLTALLVVAIATTLGMGTALRDRTQIHRATLVLEQDRARSVLLGAEFIALRLLESLDNLADLPWEGCVSPRFPLQVEGIDLLVRLENLHCRFNLNSLSHPEDPPIREFVALLERAAQEQERPLVNGEVIVAAIRDWMNPLTDDPVYRLRLPPERSGNRPFLLASEVMRVQGVTGEDWQTMASYVTALPGTTNLIDRERAPESVLGTARASDPEGPLRYMRLELVARLPSMDFFHCAILDGPNGRTILREFTPCEP